MKYALVVGLFVVLSGCETTLPTFTNAQAVTECQGRARAAAGPTGEAEIGFGNRGPSGALTLNFGNDFLRGRDPNAVFNECMDRLRANGQIVETATAV